MLLYLLQPHGHSTDASHESAEVIVDAQNNQKRRNKSSTRWSTARSIGKEDLVKRYGMRLEQAARSLRVGVSTFKRLCRVQGIPRWPSAKKMREDASVSQSPDALLSDLQHKKGDPSINQNMSGNSETTKENNMTQGRASPKQEHLYRSQLHSDSLFSENPTTDDLASIPQPSENDMICEEVRKTSISGQNRRRLESEADSMDEMSHFNEQPSEILNHSPEMQTVDNARKESSCVTSISGTIEGIEVGYNPTPESDSGHVVNGLDSTCIGVKNSLGSTSTQSLNYISSNEKTLQNTKLLFSNLIALPLEDLLNPENEASMKKVLSTLADNLSVFSEEQAKLILELKFDFPILVHSWRVFSRSLMCSQKFIADLEKNRDLVETSVKDEDSLQVRYGELESKEKQLMAQLESVVKEKARVTEQMDEKLKQTKQLVSLVEEKAARTKEKIQEKGIATIKLNSLVDQWAKIKSLFI